MTVTGARGQRRVYARAAAVATAGVLPVFLTGALAVQMSDELGFDEAGLGLTVAAFFGAAACASAIAGRAAEGLGPEQAMRLATLFSMASLAAVALFARSFPVLLLCLAIGGVGNALAQPATNLSLARQIDATRLGFAFGVKQSAIPAATFLGGVAVPAIALTVGWRWAFAGAAVAAGVVVLSAPAGAARLTGRPRSTVVGPSRDTALRPLLVLAVGCGLGAAAAGTLGSFLVSAAVESGIGEGSAGMLAGACSLTGVAARLSAGVLADRRAGRHFATVARMLAVGGLGYMLLASGVAQFLVAGALVGYCFGWGWPGLFAMAVVRANPRAPGEASGITQTGTYAGAVLGPVAFGFAAGHASYPVAWSGAAIVSFAAAIVVVVGRRLVRADRDRHAALDPDAAPAPQLGQ